MIITVMMISSGIYWQKEGKYKYRKPSHFEEHASNNNNNASLIAHY